MKKILFSLLFSLSLALVFAQNNFHHELAVDAGPLFRPSNGFTFMYRYHFNTVAIRAQANIYYKNTSNDMDDRGTTPANTNSSGRTSTSSTLFNTEFRIGLQRSWTYEKWGFYAGADAISGSTSDENKSDVKSPHAFGTTRNVANGTTSSTFFGIAPVLGLQYTFNNHFVISLENSCTFTYAQNSSSQQTAYYFTPINGVEALNNTTSSSSSGESTTVDFSPAKYLRIFIGFRF